MLCEMSGGVRQGVSLGNDMGHSNLDPTVMNSIWTHHSVRCFSWGGTWSGHLPVEAG